MLQAIINRQNYLGRGLIWAVALLAIVLYDSLRFFWLAHLPGLSNEKVIAGLMTLMHVVFPAVIGMFSDIHCRKKSMVICLVALCLSPIFFMYGWVSGGVLLEGIASGLTPVARAAFCDALLPSNRAPNIIFTFIAQSLPWVFFGAHFTNGAHFVPVLLLSGTVGLTLTLFLTKSEGSHGERFSLFRLVESIVSRETVFPLGVIFAFYLANCLWNALVYFLESTMPALSVAHILKQDAGAYYFGGCVFALLLSFFFKTKKAVMRSICLTYILIPVTLLVTGFQSLPHILSIYTFWGGGIIAISYLFLGSNVSPLRRGAVFGLMESVQSLTEFAGENLNIVSLGDKGRYWLAVAIPAISFVMLIFFYFMSKKERHS